ncbi:hypothetical protein NUU61_003449 [Penicillium alfredii]|uniref:Uncharacterized protein n=1 Tax=Penicillium alfredii TaxID=1506179 RepID=A0A9W9FJS8_9EURO|nr:uncharacterized protein NUU61_003449 [Penicillium alfredii]KAJ5101227.1 hypothetical protein NUU61_003449 [Penicillium alfredii]
MPPDTSLPGSDDILEGLPPTTHRYPYKGSEQFLDTMLREHDRCLEGEGSEYVVFTNVDERTFLQDLSESSEKLIRNSLKSYCSESQILIARMVSGPHEEAVFAFHDQLRDKLEPMHLGHSLHRFGRKTTHEGPRTKEADHGLYPRRLPAGRTDKWPSIAIEVGYAESKGKLRNDLRWWLSQSSGEVKAAISISTHKSKREIVIEIWAMTDTSSGTKPTLQQRLVISKPTADGTTDVTNAPLTVPFESLFLRATDRSEEGDIQMTEDDLRQMAEEIWETQTF